MLQNLDSSQIIGLGLVVFVMLIVIPVLAYTMRKEKNTEQHKFD